MRHSPGISNSREYQIDLMDGLVVDATELALVRKWDPNAERELQAVEPAFGDAAIVIVKCELPFAVKIQPLGANEMGTRVFRARYVQRGIHRNQEELSELSLA